MHFHTVIVGAGPGGLACARILAEHGIQPLVLERKKTIGAKVCAGGITWGGLISRVPRDLAEKSFPVQHIITRLQKVRIEEPAPIIATINRVKLGNYMAKCAREAGAEIMTGWQVKGIKGQTLVIKQKESGRQQEITFDYLVGADGSSSLVRRHLGLTSNRMGVGINYQISGDLQQMEWHLNSRFFRNGYGWIFPHRDTVSIGAYIPKSMFPDQRLKNGLIAWAGTLGFSLEKEQARADYINYDYQGWRFGRIFLIGDAAGLASGLTGEGIYPAIISGEETARTILNPEHNTAVMERLIRKQRQHSRMADWTGFSPAFNIIAGEFVTLGLRCGIIRFNKLEMAN
ncbi:MAG: NAD(P)/FAD-dependent oxidoreductase [Proteobacteria bacterium]|nr:NAD(P)/FAD-dependent oxidoreductase [Pseudomonadota bacterium]MBU1649443.1 NAD(P)/FAD-dependent oxidoreductase [Pseudomonadota bacterium]